MVIGFSPYINLLRYAVSDNVTLIKTTKAAKGTVMEEMYHTDCFSNLLF